MHINHCASWVFHITLPWELILILLVCIFGLFVSLAVKCYIQELVHSMLAHVSVLLWYMLQEQSTNSWGTPGDDTQSTTTPTIRHSKTLDNNFEYHANLRGIIISLGGCHTPTNSGLTVSNPPRQVRATVRRQRPGHWISVLFSFSLPSLWG